MLTSEAVSDSKVQQWLCLWLCVLIVVCVHLYSVSEVTETLCVHCTV